jgi:Domain of unknown function (DUF4276)
MSAEIIFLVEGQSDKIFVELIASSLIDAKIGYQIFAFNGKSDLQSKLKRRIQGWENKNAAFLVLRDKDQGDCIKVKRRLLDEIPQNNARTVKVRIACHELESWLLGDMEAIAAAYNRPNIANLQTKAKFRAPDALANAKQELQRIVGDGFGEIDAVRRITPNLIESRNKSESYHQFTQAVRDLSNLLIANSQ